MNSKDRIIEDAAVVIECANDIILEMVNNGRPSKIAIEALQNATAWLNEELERNEQ